MVSANFFLLLLVSQASIRILKLLRCTYWNLWQWYQFRGENGQFLFLFFNKSLLALLFLLLKVFTLLVKVVLVLVLNCILIYRHHRLSLNLVHSGHLSWVIFLILTLPIALSHLSKTFKRLLMNRLDVLHLGKLRLFCFKRVKILLLTDLLC